VVIGDLYQLQIEIKIFSNRIQKHLNNRMSTELAFGANFDASKILVGAPEKSKDANVFWTFPVKYGSGQFGIMETDTVTATKLKDDPTRKPKILSQGFHLENAATRKIAEDAEEAIFEALLKQNKASPELPISAPLASSSR